MRYCFVTVGSTEFDALISAIIEPECLKALNRLGITNMMMQIGRGKIIPEKGNHFGINIDFYRYKPDILPDIASADLVIGHAGAGTCLEVLHFRKSFIIVVNEELMDNHQWELAERFDQLGYLRCTVPNHLMETIESTEIFNRKSFIGPDYGTLTRMILDHMGIVVDDSS